MKTILIDNKPMQANGRIVYIKDIVGNLVPAQDHGHSLTNNSMASHENARLITGGHVYVLNYNPETYVEKKPTTYAEYQQMVADGLELWK